MSRARSRKKVPPAVLADLALALDVPGEALAALTGTELPAEPQRSPDTTGLAELIWDVRRLTADQLRQVRELAKSMAPVA